MTARAPVEVRLGALVSSWATAPKSTPDGAERMRSAVLAALLRASDRRLFRFTSRRWPGPAFTAWPPGRARRGWWRLDRRPIRGRRLARVAHEQTTPASERQRPRQTRRLARARGARDALAGQRSPRAQARAAGYRLDHRADDAISRHRLRCRGRVTNQRDNSPGVRTAEHDYRSIWSRRIIVAGGHPRIWRGGSTVSRRLWFGGLIVGGSHGSWGVRRDGGRVRSDARNGDCGGDSSIR
jgi:hypothetical protein